MSFADLKAQTRRVVHAQFAVPVFFIPLGTTVPLAVSLTARFHNKIVIASDPVGGGYPEILDGVTRVLFNREELLANGVVPKQGDIVQFPDYENVRVRLDIRDPINGPVVEKWSVNRDRPYRR